MASDVLQCPRPGHKNFEVELYNKEVRALVKQNRHHQQFSDEWADAHRQVVEAATADEARSQVADRYPEDQGFVISSVAAVARKS